MSIVVSLREKMTQWPTRRLLNIEDAHARTVVTCQLQEQREKEPQEHDNALQEVLNDQVNTTVNVGHSFDSYGQNDEAIAPYERALGIEEKRCPAKVRACLFDMDGWTRGSFSLNS